MTAALDDQIEKLKRLLDAGFLSREEFDLRSGRRWGSSAAGPCAARAVGVAHSTSRCA